jgi:nuclear GTP-binding protein
LLEHKKEGGIPNSFPFKEQVLDEEIREKQMEKLEKELKRKGKKMQNAMVDGDGLEEVKVGAIIRQELPKRKKDQPEIIPVRKSKKEYATDLKSVIEESDVVMVIVDARVPQESRPKDLEAQCAEKGKKIILVLNKADLVPK